MDEIDFVGNTAETASSDSSGSQEESAANFRTSDVFKEKIYQTDSKVQSVHTMEGPLLSASLEDKTSPPSSTEFGSSLLAGSSAITDALWTGSPRRHLPMETTQNQPLDVSRKFNPSCQSEVPPACSRPCQPASDCIPMDAGSIAIPHNSLSSCKSPSTPDFSTGTRFRYEEEHVREHSYLSTKCVSGPQLSACSVDNPRNSACSVTSPSDLACPNADSSHTSTCRNITCSSSNPSNEAFLTDNPCNAACAISTQSNPFSPNISGNAACSTDCPRNAGLYSLDSPRQSTCFFDNPCYSSHAVESNMGAYVLESPPSSRYQLGTHRLSSSSADSPRNSACSMDSPRHSACSIASPPNSACSVDSPRSPASSKSSHRHSAHLMDWECDYESPKSPTSRAFPAPVAVKIWLCRDVIIQDLRVEDIVDYLIQDEVLDTEDVEIIMQAVTTKGRTNKLLEFVLLQQDRKGCDSLLCALCLVYPHLADSVQSVKGVSDEQEYMFQRWAFERSGNLSKTLKCIQPQALLQMLASELRYQYSHRLQYVTPVPWNDAFRVPMDAVFSPLRITHASHSQWGHRCLVNPRMMQPGSIRLTDLFATLRQHCMKHRCFLLEGEPGTGKTTVCKKLVYDWATEVPSTLFEGDCHMVFFLEAHHFQEGNIVDSIYSSILPESFPITKAAMTEILAQPAIQEKILVIIDAYDEQSSTNTTLLKLLQGKVLSRATILLTSRSTFANKILRYIDVGLVVHGFACLEDKLNFVTKYGRVSNLPDAFLKELHMYLIQNEATNDLSAIPLYLWFICLLAEDNEGSIPRTRTALHESIVQLILRKAVDNGLVDANSSTDIYQQLAELAFRGMCKENNSFTTKGTDISDATLGVLVSIGLLVCNNSPLKINPEKWYSFSHKTLKEFFAAKYLQLQCANIHCFDSLFKKDSNRKWDGVMVYLSGLLRGKHDALQSLYRSVLRRDFSGICGVYPGAGERIHNRYHLPLECLHESGLFDGFEDVHQYIVPSFFHFSTMTCSGCIEGFVLSSQLARGSHQLVLDGTDLASNPLFQHRVLDSLARCINLTTLVLCNCVSIMTTLEYVSKLSAMKLQSLRHLYIYLSDLLHPEVNGIEMIGMDCATPFRTEGLQTIVLEGSRCRHYKGAGQIAMGHNVLLLMISSFLGSATQHLVLKECDVDTEVGYVLLDKLEFCVNLRLLHLESMHILHDVFSSLAVLLRHNTNSCYLAVKSCSFQDQIESHRIRGMSSLWSKLLKRNSLKHLSISSIMQPLLERTVSALHHCSHLSHLELSKMLLTPRQWDKLCRSLQGLHHLHQVSLVEASIDAEMLTRLSTTVPVMPALQSLDLSKNHLGRSPSFPQLCIAVSASNTLTGVKLEKCDITDANMVHLGLLLAGNQLEKLSLLENRLGSTPQSVDSLIELFKGKKSFLELFLPLAMFNRQRAKKLAKNLVGCSNIRTLCVASYPDHSFLQPKEFYKLYHSMHKILKGLKSFALGIDQDVTRIHTPRHTQHVAWCELLSSL